MNKKDFQKSFLPKLPDSPGIYLFKSGKNLLYVGKATSLKHRVRSYFSDDLIKTRGRLLVDMITIADKIEFQKTDSVLEALILEAHFIKESQPKYNTKDKDNKSYNYVVITDEDYPRVLVVRGRNLEQDKKLGNEAVYKGVFGPFPYGGELKEALRLIRKIFPFRDKCIPFAELQTKTVTLALGTHVQVTTHSQVTTHGQVTGTSVHLNPRPCFNRSIGLCPGVCTGEISKKDYATQIKNIKMFFEGKKPALLKSLQKQMSVLAKEKEFEKAGQIKRTIFALNHIQDVSLIKNASSGGTDFIVQDVLVNKKTEVSKEVNKEVSTEASTEITETNLPTRIEAYDIAHMSGKNMVGAMVVMEDGELANNQYRKFIIRNFDSANDPGALDEMIKRRVAHPEWQMPNIVVLDGNEVQLKRAYKAWDGVSKVLFCSIVKDKTHKAKDVLFFGEKGWEKYGKKTLQEQIVKLNAEAHRFAITFHKKRRAKSFL